VPRPETEHLVEAALRLPLPAAPRILDLGTGSGCIAVTLALELPGSRVVASDLQPAALAVARRNVERHAVGERVRLVASDLASALDLRGFDLVASNPPYLARHEAVALSPQVRDFEPPAALFSGDDGLDLVRRLLAAARALAPGRWLAFEVGAGQAARLAAALQPPLELVELVADYAGIERIVVLKRSPGDPSPS
jgi:release factor glutamine methyltransferase